MTQEGEVEHLSSDEIGDLTTITFRVRRPTKKLHIEYSRETWKMAQSLRVERSQMTPILQRLFLASAKGRGRLLALDQEGYYSFVLNNKGRLSETMTRALSSVGAVGVIPGVDVAGVTERPFHLPDTVLFTYDSRAKDQSVMTETRASTKSVSAVASVETTDSAALPVPPTAESPGAAGSEASTRSLRATTRSAALIPFPGPTSAITVARFRWASVSAGSRRTRRQMPTRTDLAQSEK